ncbi:MAG TPA: thiamine phosphate synthase [Candidatus Angelobacter sp.]|jgi:thiamine-phosphate pyrophosphorylase
MLKLPPLYPIIDFTCFATKADPVAAILHYAEEMIMAGATLIQLRDKSVAPAGNQPGPLNQERPANQPGHPNQENPTRRFLSCARELRRLTLGITKPRATLIVNDRVDLCLAADADGVHLGQDDLSSSAARKIFDQVKDGKTRLIGFSTHNISQVRQADALPIDYIAVGPVFATGSKANPDPVIGIEGVRQARQATQKPLVAIGGITRQNCRPVKDAGADSVAVISDLLESPGKAVADFLRVLG